MIPDFPSISWKDGLVDLVSNYNTDYGLDLHQLEVSWKLMRKLNRARGGLLSHEMGCGKTGSVLWTIHLLGLVNCYTALIVAPAAVVGVWKEEH